MIKPLVNNFKDILWAPARALSAKKILVMTIYLFAALFIYDIFAYIALAIEGQKISAVWAAFDLFPFYKFNYDNLFAQVIFIMGGYFSILALMFGFTGVSIIEIEAIRGNRFFSAIDALKFSLKRFKQVFLAMLGMAVFVLFVIVLFALLGLVCRIPFIGEWLYTILFVIPNFIIAIFTVFIFLIIHIAVILLPATAAADKKGEAFQAILETFSTFIRQPLRWLGYTIYSMVAGKLASFIYAYFCFRAIEFTAWASSLGGGPKMANLVKSGLTHLPGRSNLVEQTLNIFPGIDFGITLSKYARPTVSDPTSYFMAFMLLVIFATVIAYFFSVIATAQARSYVVIRYLKDDYNIADEPPEGDEG